MVYICVTGGPLTQTLAAKFAATYQAFPAGEEHEIIAACNGGPLPNNVGLILEAIGAKFFPRLNTPGWDIGAYIDAARTVCADADLMVCLGESCYFHRAGWLKRLVEARMRWGGGIYGSFTSFLVRPHINTTGFATTPALLRDYPRPVNSYAARYEFEHGQFSFWRYVKSRGMATKLVTWDGEYGPDLWRVPANIMWRGNQSNCLMFCNHTDRWDMQDEATRGKWARSADAPPREGVR